MKELRILTTDKDMTTHDLYQMGDFFETYISDIKKKMNNDVFDHVVSISPATINIISEVINFGVLSNKNVQFIPNFDDLPQKIKDGMKSGKYVLGQSKQVEGDLRAVLIDKATNTRIKDITLKEVRQSPDKMELSRNILTQLQMKQISEKLDLIYDMQKFQIKRDRDRDLIEPFFKARDYIRDAQVTKSESDRDRYLYSAMDELSNVIQAGYQEMRTCAEKLADKTQSPFLRKNNVVREYMIYICEDIYIVNKSMGIKLQIYDFLGKKAEAKAALREYVTNMIEFSEKPIGKHKESAICILQDNYPYSYKNNNLWYRFKLNITSLKENVDSIDVPRQTFLVCAEDLNE